MTPLEIFWRSDWKYSRGRKVKYCKKCKDTSYNLQMNGKDNHNICCRCGSKY